MLLIIILLNYGILAKLILAKLASKNRMPGFMKPALNPHVILATSPKCVARFKAAQREFSHMGNAGSRANQHKNMSCFNDDLMFVSAS